MWSNFKTFSLTHIRSSTNSKRSRQNMRDSIEPLPQLPSAWPRIILQCWPQLTDTLLPRSRQQIHNAWWQMQLSLTSLKKNMSNIKQLATKVRSGSGGGSGVYDGSGRGNKNNGPQTSWIPKGYCWSCGRKVHFGHTNQTCWFDQKGHNVERTRTGMMGGNDSNKDWKKKWLLGEVHKNLTSIIFN